MADTAKPVVLSPISEVPPETTRTNTNDHAVTSSETSDTVPLLRPSTVVVPAKAPTQCVATSTPVGVVAEKTQFGDEKTLMCLVAFLCPPLAVAIVLHAYGDRHKLRTYPWVCFLLCLLFAVPGFWFAVYIVFRYAGLRWRPETTPVAMVSVDKAVEAPLVLVSPVPTESAQ